MWLRLWRHCQQGACHLCQRRVQRAGSTQSTRASGIHTCSNAPPFAAATWFSSGMVAAISDAVAMSTLVAGPPGSSTRDESARPAHTGRGRHRARPCRRAWLTLPNQQPARGPETPCMLRAYVCWVGTRPACSEDRLSFGDLTSGLRWWYICTAVTGKVLQRRIAVRFRTFTCA